MTTNLSINLNGVHIGDAALNPTTGLWAWTHVSGVTGTAKTERHASKKIYATEKKAHQPICVGDVFQSTTTTWTVTECLGFGRGYWVVSADRRYQTIFTRAQLERMERTKTQ